MPFQTSIKRKQAPAVNGDFATNNPRASIVSPEAGFVAGSLGLIIGRFAWIDPVDPLGRQLLNSGGGMPDGFVARMSQGLITTYLTEAGMTIPFGFPVTIFGLGDYYMLVTVNPATRGLKVFANNTDGTMQPATTGSVIPGYTETNFKITAPAAVGELAIMTYEA